MNIIILGAPGSGKGTQGKMLAEKLGLYYFEAGNFARDLASENDRIRKIVESGELIPEDEMSIYVNSFLEKSAPKSKDIVFDGYPRSEKQYLNLKNWLTSKGRKIDLAIFLEVSDETVVERLSARRVCKNCGANFNLITNPPAKPDICDNCGGILEKRSDDYPQAIKERIDEFKERSKALLDLLQKDGILFKVAGEKSIEEINKEIISFVQKRHAYN